MMIMVSMSTIMIMVMTVLIIMLLLLLPRYTIMSMLMTQILVISSRFMCTNRSTFVHFGVSNVWQASPPWRLPFCACTVELAPAVDGLEADWF